MNGRRAEAAESILIVDDAPANLRLLSEMLAGEGYSVRVATSGRRALASVRAVTPDLILLDIRMAEMNGYEVCRHLKADRRTRQIPVIFISALDQLQDKVQAFAVGGVDYVTKPFQGEEVLARVETHLALRRLQTELRKANRALREANRRMERELALAGRVQASFLPRDLTALGGWDIAAALRPARQTSGDFYDAIPLPGGRLGLLIADVVDKGVGAALFMALSWILIRTYAVEHPTKPARVLQAVNHRVLADTGTGQFVTAFYGILDPTTGSLTYSNAGHPPPYLFPRASGDGPRSLGKTGMALGVLATETWKQITVSVEPGDVLVLYSDGVTDAENEQGAPFGPERLKASVRANLGHPAEALQEGLLADIHAFAGGAVQSDDITLMVVVRKPTTSPTP
jgi:serine phosphatase RsbU (regulator of sigma subunit)